VDTGDTELELQKNSADTSASPASSVVERLTRAVTIAAFVLAGAMASACSGPTDPSSNQTETFSGSVQPRNTGPVHTFNVPNLGELTVTVTAINPGNTFMGVGYGQVAGGNCALIQQNAVSSTNLGRTAISAYISIKGTYCVVMFDPVGITGVALTIPQNYTVQVSHP